MDKNIIKKKDKFTIYIFIVIIYILIFQNVFQKYIRLFQYFDEILAILFIPYLIMFLLNRKSLKISKYDFIILLSLFGIFVIGIYSNLKYKYQNISIAFADVLLLFKFFLTYFMFSIINRKHLFEENKAIILKNLKIIVMILFVFTLVNYVFRIYPAEKRYLGIMVNKIFYDHPTNLVAVCVFLLTSLIYFDSKVKTKYTFILIFLIFTTLRMKAIGFIIVFCAITLYINKKNKKIKFSKILILAIICVIAVYNQIEYYFIGADDSARKALLTTSFKIANNYKPFGTGFATFASYYSTKSYSPVYSLYSIQNVYGLSKGNSSFVSDNFWPMILGQFGYIGLILYGICIGLIFKKIQNSYTVNSKYQYLAKMLTLIYLLISSTSEAIFAHQLAILLVIILAI